MKWITGFSFCCCWVAERDLSGQRLKIWEKKGHCSMFAFLFWEPSCSSPACKVQFYCLSNPALMNKSTYQKKSKKHLCCLSTFCRVLLMILSRITSKLCLEVFTASAMWPQYCKAQRTSCIPKGNLMHKEFSCIARFVQKITKTIKICRQTLW